MKFTLSWLKEHLDTDAGVAEVVAAATTGRPRGRARRGSEATKLAAFSVAHIVEASPAPQRRPPSHPPGRHRLDGRKDRSRRPECASWSDDFIYAPLRTFIPGSGITLEPRTVHDVVSNKAHAVNAELQTAEIGGILELDGDLRST